MEHGDANPNLETERTKNFSVADFQDEGGDDTSVAGPSESKEFLFMELKTNPSIETTKLKDNNDSAETLEFGNNNIIETINQDKKNGKNHYVCRFCSQEFNKHQALGGHMNGHSKDQRNLKKFEKITTWIHETYPPPPNATLASEAELLYAPTNGAIHNSYNHPIEVGNVYSQLGGQHTNQQPAQQIQQRLSQGLSQGSQIQQRQQLEYHRAQEPQPYQYSQGLQSNQSPKIPQSTQALQRLQKYQTPRGIQNHQASQEPQSYQTPQQFQNYQTSQEPRYYQALQGSQNYQVPEGPQYHQTPQRFQNYQTLEGPWSYQTPQGSQSYQAPQRPQSYQIPQASQSYQTPRGQLQQLVVDANNQQNINLNSKTSNKPTSFAKVPSNDKKNNSSNSQDFGFQKEAQGPQRYMPNPHNLRNGDHLTTGLFINEHLNEEYYAQLGSNVLRRGNEMISIPHNYDTVDQNIPTNPPNTSNSINQSKDE